MLVTVTCQRGQMIHDGEVIHHKDQKRLKSHHHGFSDHIQAVKYHSLNIKC
jgi:hypothetical protein